MCQQKVGQDHSDELLDKVTYDDNFGLEFKIPSTILPGRGK